MNTKIKKTLISFIVLLTFLLTSFAPALASTGTPETIQETAITQVEPEPESVTEPIVPEPEPVIEEVKEVPVIIEPVEEIPKESPPSEVVEIPTEPTPEVPVEEPVKEESAPVVEEPAPVVEEPAPEVPVEEPVKEEPVLVVEEPAPEVPVEEPVKEEPVPVIEEPAPVVEEPIPEVPVEEPVKVLSPMLTPAVSSPEIATVGVPFTDGPKYYYSTEAYIALCATFKEFSTNGHTLPERVWVQLVGDELRVFLAVKSTHTLDFVEINGIRGLFDAQYAVVEDIMDPVVESEVYVDDELLPVSGLTETLNGNTKDTRWTVFSWPLSAFNIGFESVNTIFVDGIGGGHDVTDELLIQIPTTKLKIMKEWQGMNPPNGTTVAFDIYGMPANVKIAETSMVYPDTEVIIDVPVSTETGQLYTHYKVVETSNVAGYDSDSPQNSVKTDINVLSVDCTGDRYFKRHDVTITNTPEPIDIMVEKKWVGGETLAVEISVLLRRKIGAEGTWVTVGSKMLNSGNGWKATWENEPRVNSEGQYWIYGIVESGVPADFTPVVVPLISNNGNISFTITNTYTIPKINIDVDKVWIGGPMTKPNVTIHLMDGTTMVDQVTLIYPDLEHTFTNVPKTRTDGTLIVYTITEEPVPGYSTLPINGFTVTNDFDEGERDIPVTKIWVGGPLVKPSVTINLLADGVELDQFVMMSGVTSHTFMDLPVFKSNGETIVYSITEDPVPGYISEINGFTVTNDFDEGEKDIPVNKIWIGGPLVKPSITINLMADGVDVDSVILANGSTEYIFEDWPIYKSDGTTIVYAISENFVPGYISSIEGFTATNDFDEGLRDISVTKVWEGGVGARPTITINLLADGAEVAQVVLPAGDTEHTFTGLPIYKSNGTAILYTITEDPVTDYETNVVGFTVFNTWDGELPFTGTTNSTALPMLGVLVALGGVALIRRKRHTT